MTIREHRLSTQVVAGTFLDPDGRDRQLDEDYELGPLAPNDTSLGIAYQPWHLTWDGGTGDFTITPETAGTPVAVLNAAGVTQCSLAFDNNAHVNIAYTANGNAYLYWYDTLITNWTTTNFGPDFITPTLTLDDKRDTQSVINDIILWYTKLNPDGETYNLYTREQRDRFLTPYDMGAFQPYLYKIGMDSGLRIQIAGSSFIF